MITIISLKDDKIELKRIKDKIELMSYIKKK